MMVTKIFRDETGLELSEYDLTVVAVTIVITVQLLGTNTREDRSIGRFHH
jgi:Flp pilus assembly pilin Flp